MNIPKFIYNNPVVNNINLSKHELTLFCSLEKYYCKNIDNFILLIEIINSKSLISRRSIEFFVTNYCKMSNNYEKKYDTINIYSSYKDQLKAFKKIYFDPFGRGIRIPFIFKDYYLITTIAQLNFYRWFFQNNFYKYLIENYSTIQKNIKLTKNKISKKSQFKNNYTVNRNNNKVLVEF